MVDTRDLENYLSEKICKDGDMCEILEEGVIEEKVSLESKRTYKQINIPVKLNGIRNLIYSPDKDAVSALQFVFGYDSKEWIGKRFTIKLYPKMSFGKKKIAIMPVPMVEEKVA